MSRQPRARASDDGFTLPELLISIVILSFIVGAIGFALTVVLRNTRATAERNISNLGAQALTAWFTGDVEGADALGAGTDPGAVTGCPGEDPGTNVLLLPRADAVAGVVSYRLVSTGTELELWRVVCVDGARRQNVVVQSVTDPAQVVVTRTPADGGLPFDTVSLRVTTGVALPTTVELTGSPRTRDVPDACGLASATPLAQLVLGGALQAPMTFTVHMTGACTEPLRLDVPSLGTPAAHVVDLLPVSGQPGSYTGTLPVGGTWGMGTRPVAVSDAAGPAGRFDLLLSDLPCTLSSSTPSTFEYRPLGPPIPFRLETAGPCTNLSLSVATGGSPASVTPSLTQLTSTTWSASLPGDTTWSPGRKTVNVLRSGANLGTVALDMVPAPCRFISATTAAPPRTDASGRLTGNLGVTVTTDGVCGTVGLSIPTGGGPQDPFVVSPLAGGPITWTTTLPRLGQTWTPGLRDATVTNDADVLGTFAFDLREVCSMIGNGPSTLAVGSDFRALAATTFNVRTRGTCGTVTLRFSTGRSPSTFTRTLTTAGDTHTTVVAPADATWAIGSTQTMRAFNDGNSLGTWNVSITQPCTVTGGGPRRLAVTPTSPKRLVQDTTITVTVNGPCPQPLSIRLPTGGPVDPIDVALQPSGTPGTYQATVRPADAEWTVDVATPRTARIYSGVTEIGSFLYVVSDCAVVSGAPTISVGGGRVDGGERIRYQTNGGSACRSTMTVVFDPPGTNEQNERADASPAPAYETDELGGLRWNSGQPAVTVTVYNSTSVLDESTYAGQFQVVGT